ncbi:MAG: hypothetical protein LBL07_03825 [Tannerella sp.]|jgi:hypothetical protein|nr:hypothetical protein [Tannerella sp.]
MKPTIIINWLLSFMALGTICTETSSMAAVLIIFAWFVTSSLILINADKKKKNEHKL